VPPRYPTLLFGPRAKFTGVAKPASAAGAGKLAAKHPEGTTDVMVAIDHEATAEKIVGWVGKQAPLSECKYTLAPKRELETQLGSALRERPRKGSVAAATMRDGETARMDTWDMETAAAMALDFAVRRKTCGKEACEYNAKKKKALGDFVQVREREVLVELYAVYHLVAKHAQLKMKHGVLRRSTVYRMTHDLSSKPGTFTH
jgi:hypothetical protein